MFLTLTAMRDMHQGSKLIAPKHKKGALPCAPDENQNPAFSLS